jgi:hypothetical protein
MQRNPDSEKFKKQERKREEGRGGEEPTLINNK